MSAISTSTTVLTVDEAAAELRIGRTAAYEAVKRGEIPVLRIGRTLRVPRHALERMLGHENDEGHRAGNAMASENRAGGPDASTG